MKGQRGSVTVIAVVMLLFLMISRSLAADDDNGKNGCCV